MKRNRPSENTPRVLAVAVAFFGGLAALGYAGGVFARLDAMKTSLNKTPFESQFDYFVLSDSSNPRTIDAETAACSAFRAKHGETSRLTYRLRTSNEGFKAGNVRDFCEKTGWNKTSPGPALPPDVVAGTRARYIEAFEKLTGIGFATYLANPSIVLASPDSAGGCPA